MWNDEIKQNIIQELTEQLDAIAPTKSVENHSYADSIFSPITTNMFKPLSNNVFEIPNYFETTIARTRTIKEIPIHTMAFSDSFNTDKPPMSIGFAFSPGLKEEKVTKVSASDQVYEMDQIINSSSTITISLTPEQRGVAIVTKPTWKDILFEDASLIKNTSFAEAVKKICSIQIKF